MTNEDLLLEISKLMDKKLETINKRLDRLEERMDRLEERMDRLEERMDRLEEKVNSLEEEIRKVDKECKSEIHKVWLILENDMQKKINLIVENFPSLRQMKNIMESNDLLKIELDVHSKVISNHSERIQALEKTS